MFRCNQSLFSALGWLLAMSLPACDQRAEKSSPIGEAYFKRVMQIREHRDQQFKTAADSPIPAPLRATFQGLSYFPIHPRMRFRLKLHRIQPPDTVWIMTTHGQDRPALKWGYFDFTVQKTPVRLFAYVFLDHAPSQNPRLFIPFRDATSGKLTYSGGRYLYLPLRRDDRYVLDFNLAFNPACAYGNTDYVCPIPPPENSLPVAVLAGEKIWEPPQSP